MRTTDKQYDTNEDLLPTTSIEDNNPIKTENNASPIKISINSPEKLAKDLIESIDTKKEVQHETSAILIGKEEEVKSIKEEDQNSKLLLLISNRV